MDTLSKKHCSRILPTIALSISLGACTSAMPTSYTKPGYTQEAFHRDKVECEQEAYKRLRVGAPLKRFPIAANIQLNKYANECLTARGYTPQ